MALSIVLCDEDERYLVPLELKFRGVWRKGRNYSNYR